jgi:hypothetical protein
MNTNLLLKLLLDFVMSSFIAATALSFLLVRLRKKEAQFAGIISVLGLGEEEVRVFSHTVRDEYSGRDYVLPVLFTSLVSVAGFTALFFGADLVTYNAEKPNLLLTAGYSNSDPGKITALRFQSMLVLTLAFVGAFIWSAREIIRRLVSGDLTPSVYYSAGMRVIFASLLSLMILFLNSAMPFAEYTSALVPVVAFLTGMLPDQAMIYLRSRIPMFSAVTQSAAELPLEMIEGVNAFHKVRLGEVGIDNAQNLAEANLVELLLKTPFTATQLIDWIAQAKLYLMVKDDIGKLRGIGIRTILDFMSVAKDPERLRAIAQEAQVSELALGLIQTGVAQDASVTRLGYFRTRLGALGQAEQLVKA